MTFARRLSLALALALAVSGAALADDEGWMEDFEAAKAKAAAEGKDLLLDFTGSDWCGWCIRLKSEVFDQEAFKTGAPKNFVLVELDYPQNKEQTEATKTQNQKLQQQFGIQGFPSIYLADAKGLPYAKTGYQEGGPEKYLAHLDELRKKKAERDEAFKKAEGVEGAEKARALDAALELLVKDEIATAPYTEVVDQILALDAKNEAGLRGKYEGAKKLAEIEGLMNGGDIDGGIKMVDEFVADPSLGGEVKQKAYYLKGAALHHKQDAQGTLDALKAALEAAPESELAPRLKEIIQQLGG